MRIKVYEYTKRGPKNEKLKIIKNGLWLLNVL